MPAGNSETPGSFGSALPRHLEGGIDFQQPQGQQLYHSMVEEDKREVAVVKEDTDLIKNKMKSFAEKNEGVQRGSGKAPFKKSKAHMFAEGCSGSEDLQSKTSIAADSENMDDFDYDSRAIPEGCKITKEERDIVESRVAILNVKQERYDKRRRKID